MEQYAITIISKWTKRSYTQGWICLISNSWVGHIFRCYTKLSAYIVHLVMKAVAYYHMVKLILTSGYNSRFPGLVGGTKLHWHISFLD